MLGSSDLRLSVLVAEWIHFTRFGTILPTLKLKVYTFGGLMNSATKVWPCHVVSAGSQSQAVEIALLISSNSWCMAFCNCEVLLQARSSCFVAARQAGLGVAGAREGGRAAEEVGK